MICIALEMWALSTPFVQLGKIIVIPIDDSEDVGHPFSDDHQPLMLLALNATDLADWAELLNKVRSVYSCKPTIYLLFFRERFLLVIWQNH